jgi:hypothetical protein
MYLRKVRYGDVKWIELIQVNVIWRTVSKDVLNFVVPNRIWLVYL